MFFDLEKDPGEMKNLAAQPTLAMELDRHRTLLAEWNQLTEEASHPIQPLPQAQAGKGQKDKGRNKSQGKKARQKNE
jgi:hypothetical protein